MAELEKYPVPLYNPLHPYHWEYDNLPLKGLIDRDEAINGQLESVVANIQDAQGTQGTLANRLNQSLDPSGSLKYTAIDEADHNIAMHNDGVRTLTDDEIAEITALGYVVSNPVPYVRMWESERAKLALIANEATNMTIQVDIPPSNIVLYTQGPITFTSSPTVTWGVEENKIKANLAFPVEAAHRHYYDLEPITSDYQNYEVTSVATEYMENSLRVYINGFRISSSADIYIPGNLVTDAWTLNSFTADNEAGTFVLTNAITVDDVIRIDFDVMLT